MFVIVKVFMLLAVAACVAKTQPSLSNENCLCNRVRNTLIKSEGVRDIQIYPPTVFCSKMEIVVTSNKGRRFCLDPNKITVQTLIHNIMRKVKPTPVTSTANIGLSL
ncbi:C-X-C motif chemokine 10-like [Cynoglossus semilaevis]|uniref:C-X-C motif chemokine 10-like n=1 Tax=Cynoglossus semilaevis TaxID=244447 RepID=A0A3P8VS31_CYNSE|nr:C-X-C motif chemokine 10-like [Cynoglossus semilaevis]